MVVIFLVLVALAGVGIGIAYFVGARKRNQKILAEYAATCKVNKLDKDERAILDQIVAVGKIRPVTRIFTSKNMFDRAVAMWTKTVGAANSEEKAEILGTLRKKLNFAKAKEGVQVASSRSILPKQILEVELTDRKPPIKFKPVVLQVDDFGITIQIPPEIEHKVFFRHGEPVDAVFTRPGEGTYGFATKVQGIPHPKKLILDHSEKLNVTQQRGHVRVDIRYPAKFKRIPSEVIQDRDKVARVIGDDQAEMISGEVTNLSGDGAMLRVPQEFAKNDHAWFKLQLDSQEKDSKITFYCRVLGSSPHPNGKEFFLRTQFVDMSEPIRERIIQFLFKFQTESLKEQSGR